VFVQDAVDGTVSVVDTNFFGLEDQIPAHLRGVDPQIQIGARLFNSSVDPGLSANRLISCASCHYEGLSDGRTWGVVTTPVLAERDTFDAITINAHIQTVQGGTGLEVGSVEMAALMAYLQNLD
jgi:hypothetical protein